MNHRNPARFPAVLLAAVLSVISFSGAAASAGMDHACGEDLTWKMDDDGVLTISGTGEMYSYIEQTPRWDSHHLKKVIFEPGVTGIGALAFDGCHSLRSVEIPDTVTSIGDYAFSRCMLLKDISLPDSIREIGANPFSECRALSSISLSPDHPVFSFQDGMLLSKPDQRLITCAAGSGLTGCAIPAGTRIIGDEALSGCRKLRSVTIPDSVTTIGRSAFYECEGLTSLDLPESVETIGRGAFSHCEHLRSVTLREGLRSIGARAFNCCRALEEIAFPDSLESIETTCFDVCQSLSRIHVSADHPCLGFENGILYTKADQKMIFYAANNPADTCRIPDGIRIIGRNAFGNGDNLKTLILPESVREIGESAFSGCFRAEDIVFSQGLEIIGKSAFSDMDMLKDVTLPESVTVIGDHAFSGCEKLESVRIPDSVSDIGKAVFTGTDTLNLVIYVTEGSAAEEYCRANGLKAVLPGQEIPEPKAELPAAFAEQYPGYRGLCEAEPPADNEAVYLAQRPDESLVLLCGTLREGSGWTVIESAPLPAETRVTLYDGIRLLDLDFTRFTVRRYYDDVWGIDHIEWRECFVGPVWVGSGPFSRYFGVHSWRDLTTIDWMTLEGTTKGLIAAMDLSTLAAPAGKNPETGTPIYSAPDPDSGLIAELVAGAPLFVTGQSGGWTHVTLGRDDGGLWKLDGWVRTSDLAFGNDAEELLTGPSGYTETADFMIDELNWFTTVDLVDPAGSRQVPAFEYNGEKHWVIGEGVIGGQEYFLVYDCFSDLAGFILKTSLYNPD